MFVSQAKPWLKYYSQNAIEHVLPERTLYEQLHASNDDYPNGIALSYFGTEITYGEMMKSIDEYAEAFSHVGIKKGDYVSFYTVTLPETVYSIYALNKIGAVCNLIDVRTDALHAKEFIAKANSTVVIALDLFVGNIADSFDDLGLKTVIIQSASDSLSFIKKMVMRHKLRNAYDSSIVDNKRVFLNKDFVAAGKGTAVEQVVYENGLSAVVVRTGGTTGVSKGVLLTNDGMNAVYESFIAAFVSLRGDKILNFLPLAASYGIVVGIHSALCGSLVNILIPNFTPDDFADLVYKYKPNHIVGVPVFYENMMKSPKIQKSDLSFLKTMGAGGDSAHPTLEKRLLEFGRARGVKHPLSSGYGMSEVSSAVAFGVLDVHKDGSVGIPTPYTTIAAFEPGTTNELPAGEIGEICISGNTLMKGYLNEPEETDYIMWKHSDGQMWIHSGDLGLVDEDGFVFIKGRIKRTIPRFDGHKNYPTQIEAIVSQHKAVMNNIVVGIRDINHEKGELPLIITTLKPQYILDSNVSKEENLAAKESIRKDILNFVCENIEKRSQPYDVVIVDKLPLTANGKFNIKLLEERYYDYMTNM